MVYNETLKQEVPANWSVCELQDLVEIRRGATITKKDVGISGAVKVVAAGLDYSYFHNKSNRKKNTITVSASGANAGYIRLWREPIYASDCITLNGETDSMTFYAWGYLQLVRGHVSQQARGSAQPHVYPSDLATLPIAIPPIKLFEQFKSIVVPVQEEVGLYETQNDNLVKLRDSLLPLLMNGQASLKD